MRKLTVLTVVATLAGIIYNSWPLAYWLNPYVGRHDLASELEAMHQPYNWLFILCDIVCGLLVVAFTLNLGSISTQLRSGWQRWVVDGGLLTFGIGTILDATLPIGCDPSVQHCSLLDPVLLLHGFFSIAASFGLFVTMIMFAYAERRSTLMHAVLVGYLLFGIFSLVSVLEPGQDSWAQHYSLLLDGVCLAIVPYVSSQLRAEKNRLLRLPAVKIHRRPQSQPATDTPYHSRDLS